MRRMTLACCATWLLTTTAAVRLEAQPMPTMPGTPPPAGPPGYAPPPAPPPPPPGAPPLPGGLPPAPQPPPPPPPPGHKPLMPQGMIEGETELSGERTLKGHTFHYPLLIPNAFTAPSFYVGSSIEFYHQGDVPGRVTLEDGTVASEFTFDRDLGFVRLRYGVDFQPTRYVSFGLDADYLAEVGANEETLFLYGGQTGFDFRPNLKVRLVRSDRFGSQLGIRVHGTFQAGIRAVPQGLLSVLESQLGAIAQDVNKQKCLVAADFACAFAGSDANVGDAIRLTRSRNGGGGSLNFAQALNQNFGGQASIGLEGAKTTVSAPLLGDIDATGLSFHAGVAPAVNIYPALPVALAFEYRFQLDKQTYAANDKVGIATEQSVSAKSHRLGFGLYYTGRRDLMLGWVAGLNFLQDVDRALNEVETQPDAFIFAAQFEMRYFF